MEPWSLADFVDVHEFQIVFQNENEHEKYRRDSTESSIALLQLNGNKMNFRLI